MRIHRRQFGVGHDDGLVDTCFVHQRDERGGRIEPAKRRHFVDVSVRIDDHRRATSGSLGLWKCHGVADSYAAAMRRTISSPEGGPATWRPIGRPSSPKPHGTEIAGWPVTLNGSVRRMNTGLTSSTLPPTSTVV